MTSRFESTSSDGCNRTRCAALVASRRLGVRRPPSLIAGSRPDGPAPTVLVQVNATGEPSKGGCDPGDVGDLVANALNLNLNVSGLMTIGPADGDPVGTRHAFTLVRALADELGLTTCSMGMSLDLDIAIDCGTTRVRLGTALFGERPR